jgi:HK97 family phage prohead protease
MAVFKTWMMRAETAEDGTTLVTASTPEPDRMGDVVAPDWNLDRYEGNPIVAWAHDYSIPPVGRAVGLALEGDTLVARIKWDDAEANPLGQTVAHQFREGFLSAVSVGFAPGKSTARAELPEDHPAAGKGGYYFEGNELLEISAVPIPANPEALAIRAKQYGLDVEGTIQRHILDVQEDEDTVTITMAKDTTEGAPEDAPAEEEGEQQEQDFWADEDAPAEEPAKSADALEATVRATLLELLGYDSQVQDAVDAALTDDPAQEARDGWADLFDND